jgi:hypothetical protein
MDIPSGVLAQLGLKYNMQELYSQWPKIHQTNFDNYPTSEYYTTEDVLTSLGIGSTCYSIKWKGIPTPSCCNHDESTYEVEWIF